MTPGIPRKISSLLCTAGLLLAMLAPIGDRPAAASTKYRSVATAHRTHHRTTAYHSGYPRPYEGTLPYGPEYGFLTHVPPNAIRMPGYTFVPGIGILGESCDLPTSACTNEYRDVK